MRARKSRGLPDPKKTWSQAEGRTMIEAWRRSGLTLNQFALRHGTTEQRLGHWRKQLEEWTSEPGLALAPATTIAADATCVRAIVQVEGVTIAIEGAEPEYVAQVARALTRSR